VLRFDDLLAARLIHQQRPALRTVLAEGLRALDAHQGKVGFRTLLGDLLKQGALHRQDAERIHGQVEQYKRGRALGIYAQLLSQQGGVERAVVDAAVAALGEAVDSVALGRALVEAGNLSGESADRLRFLAKRAYDLDQARHIEAYRGRTDAEVAATLVGEAPLAPPGPPSDTGIARALEEERVPTGVFRSELVLPSEAETTRILDRAALDLSRANLAPRFPIPDWIDTTDPMVGVVVGPFRIVGKVGAGAMATVYLASDEEATCPVALKLLPPAADDERKARFKREILANGFFNHEGVIDIYDAGTTEQGFHYLAMEFFDGTDLEGVLKTEGSISLRQSLAITTQILQALDVAHQAGIVHRDIKPSNILVAPDGATAKLMDFGIALIQDLGEFKDKVFESDAGGVTGTPQYLAPEQAFRDPVSPATDLYSLGIVLFEMLAGRLPFRSETISGWLSCHMVEQPLSLAAAAPDGSFPPGLQELVDAMLVKSPRDRIQSAREVLDRLGAVQASLSADRRSRLFGKVRRGF